MWFIKVEFWDEFQVLIKKYDNETEVIKKIKIIKASEEFCKQGKGVSFYNVTTINNKFMKKIEKYLNDENYCQYNLKK
ncbi:hypothetical protein SAMN02745134_00813 [Clostridium acidisoli DSM 12555]|uniref:Uncharacterized protein n=1 Tax=Clostridium acidisoli DSM 12555 TaxID=1121291 RepID=A0A1W1X6B7_9CLOT|nr:hypothetical protein [Clostridium acidisoli]SMC19367.1 hypothetical protein SAMN02745134_00813 [Clostridium acidisoli DSM 12555]